MSLWNKSVFRRLCVSRGLERCRSLARTNASTLKASGLSHRGQYENLTSLGIFQHGGDAGLSRAGGVGIRWLVGLCCPTRIARDRRGDPVVGGLGVVYRS